MTSTLRTLAAASAMTMLLGASVAGAQTAYSDWDTDGTTGISQDEFRSGLGDTGIYGDWDADGDGVLSENEYYDGYYNYYDADGNGVIEEPEFGDLGDDMGDGGLFDV